MYDFLRNLNKLRKIEIRYVFYLSFPKFISKLNIFLGKREKRIQKSQSIMCY